MIKPRVGHLKGPVFLVRVQHDSTPVPANYFLYLHTCDNLVVAVKPLGVHPYDLVASLAGLAGFLQRHA